MSNSTAQAESEITVDVLDVWRHYVPWGAAAVTRRVKGAVVEGLQLIERQDLVERILACDGAACVEAAGLSCDEVAPDWRPLCLWLAVRLKPHGQTAPYARLALAMRLADEAERARRGDDPANWTRLSSLSAAVLASADLSPNREKLVALLSGETDTSPPGRPGAIAGLLRKLPQAEEDAEGHDADGYAARRLPRRRVLPEGISDGVTDAAKLKARFPVLLKSMPSTPLPDLDAVEAALLGEMPWMETAVERVIGDLRVARLLGGREFRIRPLLLLGPPGVGKSRFGRRLATLAQAPFGVVAAGGSSDSRSLAGTASGWSSAQPAYPVMLMASAQRSSAVVLVDEIDKSGGGERNGKITDTLLSMTEAETARRWPDECLCAPVDLSGISWIATANTTEGLPTALLDRFGVVEVGRPGPEAFDAVLDGVLDDLAAEFRAGRTVATTLRALIEREALDTLRGAWVETGSPRRLRGLVHVVLAAVAKSAGRH